ncbi:MAG TPA: hypothetical protein VIH52_01245 [Candidatus Nanoarchaeia archaeon]|nr:hypothetical protein [uncultured archaeon]
MVSTEPKMVSALRLVVAVLHVLVYQPIFKNEFGVLDEESEETSVILAIASLTDAETGEIKNKGKVVNVWEAIKENPKWKEAFSTDEKKQELLRMLDLLEKTGL